MNPLVSIVIPAREEERDIEVMVRQFAALSLPHEVIVSDGASTDRTVERARAAGAIVVEGTNGVRSPAKQRNDGAKAARGEFILFVDVTVRFRDVDEFVKKALAHFSDPAIAGMSFRQHIYPEIATASDRFFIALINFYVQITSVGSGKCMLCRRSAYIQIGGLREELISGEDRDFLSRLKTAGRVICAPDLSIEYSGRREHRWGWAKLMYIWLRDTLWIALFGHSRSEDWAPVR